MIVLITGVMAAGKSTVAELLAEKFLRSVHLRGDVFRRMVVNGRADMGGAEPEEALKQLELRYRLAVQTARDFDAAGFAVVYQDVILGSWLPRVVSMFGDCEPGVVVLRPNRDTVEVRELGRAKSGYGNVSVDELQQGLAETPEIGLWVDSSDQTPQETVTAILEGLSLPSNDV